MRERSYTRMKERRDIKVEREKEKRLDTKGKKEIYIGREIERERAKEKERKSDREREKEQ